MTDETKNTTEETLEQAPIEAVEVENTEAASALVSDAPAALDASAPFSPFTRRPRQQQEGERPRRGTRGGRGGPRREPRAKPEFDQKIIDIRRVTRVASGGRRFSFAVSLVAGDKRGRVGVGTGKGGDTALAVEKALRNAKKNMITLNLTKSGSIPHEVFAKFSSAQVHMMPAPGKGVVAGSSVRDVIDLAGVKDITAKLRSGTKNKLNNARVAIEALLQLKKPRANSK